MGFGHEFVVVWDKSCPALELVGAWMGVPTTWPCHHIPPRCGVTTPLSQSGTRRGPRWPRAPRHGHDGPAGPAGG